MEKGRDDLSEKIIGAAFRVQNSLGTGFLEKVYKKSLIVELEKSGLSAEEEKKIEIFYRDVLVGEYFADIVVNNEFIVEIKAVEELANIHTAQILNYLKATGIKRGLLINFGQTKVEFKRYVV
ncbi:MAG: GxxExxY protein [Candidatus Aureabacteria bacterium]|nr:GxxExxY protein [Candidatus Auribacterota bacterium]